MFEILQGGCPKFYNDSPDAKKGPRSVRSRSNKFSSPMIMDVDEIIGGGGGDPIHIGFSSVGKDKDDLISILNRGDDDFQRMPNHRLESSLSPIIRTKSNEQRQN